MSAYRVASQASVPSGSEIFDSGASVRSRANSAGGSNGQPCGGCTGSAGAAAGAGAGEAGEGVMSLLGSTRAGACALCRTFT